jgi:hypothetical protein
MYAMRDEFAFSDIHGNRKEMGKYLEQEFYLTITQHNWPGSSDYC